MFKNGLSLIVAQRLWQGLAGLITVLVITSTLTQEQQGWYYTFLSIAALYSIFEMGLSSVLIQVSARMFIKLHWLAQGRVSGDGVLAFTSFFHRSVRAYFLFAIVFLVISFLIGFNVFSHKHSQSISVGTWLLPWLGLVIFTALNMLTLPFLAIVEGSGEIAEVYGVRLMQGIFGAILCWLVLWMGGWLWATLMMPFCSVLIVIFWILIKRIGLARKLFSSYNDNEFSWSLEVLPLQWRVGLNWISVFLMAQLATPILFYYLGPVIAGQMGLSLTITNMLGILSQSWIAQRVPAMSQAVVKREWAILDHLFKKDFTQSLVVFVLGALMLVVAHMLISKTGYIVRVLPFWPFVGLLLFVFFCHINGALSAQLRSFQREPLIWVSVAGALIIVPASIYAAKLHSFGGMVMIMLGVQVILVFPLSYFIWRRCNKKWRLLPDERIS